jgi:hypothetical protein
MTNQSAIFVNPVDPPKDDVGVGMANKGVTNSRRGSFRQTVIGIEISDDFAPHFRKGVVETVCLASVGRNPYLVIIRKELLCDLDRLIV